MAGVAAKPYSKEYLVNVGRVFGSDKVRLEASEALARWTRDVGPLACYGYGPVQLERFRTLLGQHSAMMESRPDSVAGKRNTVAAKAAGLQSAQVWVDQTVSILELAALRDAKLAVRLDEATAREGLGELPATIQALKKLLEDAKPLAPEDADVDARVAEADGLASKLAEAPGSVTSATAAKLGDTADLDYLDGLVVVTVRNLNRVAKKAIRNGTLNAQLSEYQLNHLSHAQRSPKAPLAPAVPAEPTK